jgi:hypothetical protein
MIRVKEEFEDTKRAIRMNPQIEERQSTQWLLVLYTKYGEFERDWAMAFYSGYIVATFVSFTKSTNVIFNVEEAWHLPSRYGS